jgi:hypothetical protein
MKTLRDLVGFATLCLGFVFLFDYARHDILRHVHEIWALSSIGFGKFWLLPDCLKLFVTGVFVWFVLGFIVSRANVLAEELASEHHFIRQARRGIADLIRPDSFSDKGESLEGEEPDVGAV